MVPILYHVFNKPAFEGDPVINIYQWKERPGVVSNGSTIGLNGIDYIVEVREDWNGDLYPLGTIVYDLLAPKGSDVQRLHSKNGWSDRVPMSPAIDYDEFDEEDEGD